MMRILLVEDDPLIVELFVEALRTDGHEIDVARDGSTGERRARDGGFDLILMDIRLPDRSGLEVCRSLRGAGFRIPIVALSASVMPEDVARTSEAGFTQFVGKPVSPAALRAVVRSHEPPERED